MVEVYAIEGRFDWKTNTPEVLRTLQRGFEDIDRRIRDTQETLGRFANDIKELSGGTRGIAALSRALDRLKVPDAALTGLREVTAISRQLAEAQSIITREATQSAAAFRAMAEASRGIRSGGGGRGGGHASLLDGAMASQMAGDAGVGLLERGFHAYGDVQMGQALAQSDKRVTDAVMARANNLIATLQKAYPALTQSEGLTLFRNTMGIFGDANESLSALPGAVRLQQLYQLAPAGRGGAGGSEVQAAEKAGDALQAFIDPRTGKLDRGLYDKWMDFQSRSYLAGGDLVDAKNWLSFARTSRSAGIGLSQNALEEAQALLEMSPGRTGTALMSAFQVFGASTSHMTKKNRAAWQDAWLLGQNGGIIDQQLYANDPFQWVWKDLLPKLADHGVQSRDQILKWLTDHGQRGTVAGILSDIAIGKTPITNTVTKLNNQNGNTVDKLENTDLGKLAALHAAETNFFVALGKFGEGPGLALLTKLTDALNTITATANAHPEAATRTIAIGAGLAVLAKVMGDASMTALFVGGPLMRGLGALSKSVLPFAEGGEAASALGVLAGPASVFGSLAALAAAVLLLPPILKTVTDLLPSGHPNSGKTAPTHGGGNYPLTPPPPAPGQSWHDYLWGSSGAHPGANMRSGAAQPINVFIDGKKVAGALMGSSGVQRGTTGFDGTRSLMPSGIPQGIGN